MGYKRRKFDELVTAFKKIENDTNIRLIKVYGWSSGRVKLFWQDVMEEFAEMDKTSEDTLEDIVFRKLEELKGKKSE